MKKLLFALVLIVAITNLMKAEEAARTLQFFVDKVDKIDKGDYNRIMQIIAGKIPGIIIDAEERSFCILDVPMSTEKELIASLKSEGHNVLTDPKYPAGNVYLIRALEDGPKPIIFEVDTSAIRDNISRIKELQKILDMAIVGGKSDPFKTKKGNIPFVKGELIAANFNYVFSQTETGVNTITITERDIPVTIRLTNSLQFPLIAQVLKNQNVKYSMGNNVVLIALCNDDFRKIRSNLQEQLGELSVTAINFSYMIDFAKPISYKLRMILNKNEDFEEQKKQILAQMSSEFAKKNFIVKMFEEEHVGTKCLLDFTLESYQSEAKILDLTRELLNPCKVPSRRISIKK